MRPSCNLDGPLDCDYGAKYQRESERGPHPSTRMHFFLCERPQASEMDFIVESGHPGLEEQEQDLGLGILVGIFSAY